MNMKLSPGWFYGGLIVVLAGWILHSFLQALLAACVTAIASWPLYVRFASLLPRRTGRSTRSLIFTCAISVFVLVPVLFAFGALLTEAHALLVEIAAADKQGIAIPHGLENVPLIGPWVAARWQSELGYPGALFAWTQRTDPAALLGWAQSLAQFMVRHAFIIGFTILMLFFLYQEGESLAEGFRGILRHRIGERADGYVDLATRAVRASINSMLLVALFDGLATGIAYAIAGVPHAAVWAAITGLLALVPFLGYVAVAALTLQLAMTGAAGPALLSVRPGLRRPLLWRQDRAAHGRARRNSIALRLGTDGLPRRLRGAWTCRARYRPGRAHSPEGTVGTERSPYRSSKRHGPSGND